MAFGHQNARANFTPSSFVSPNFPFRILYPTNASQCPLSGSPLKLHGQPYVQLQLWMYSVSKPHFVAMMVAMMLPSALPMALAYHGISRLEDGRPTKPADLVGTVAFLIPYFGVWGFFGVVAIWGLLAFGLIGSMLMGPALLLSAATLVAAGLWQMTRSKEACLSHCVSPTGFMLHHWRNGRLGAMRMGFRHSMYCVGCCWLFMLVLFVSGSMSLLWMGGISVAIFGEKLGVRTVLFSRAIGVILVSLGAVVAVRFFHPM